MKVENKDVEILFKYILKNKNGKHKVKKVSVLMRGKVPGKVSGMNQDRGTLSYDKSTIYQDGNQPLANVNQST